MDEQTMTQEEKAIRGIVQTLAEGWNAGDGDLFAEHFAKDADYMVWNGNYAKGQQNIAEGHNHIFSTIYKDTKMRVEIEKIRFLRDDVAIVHTKGGVVAENKRWPTVRPTLVLTRQDDRWQIDVFQNTPILQQQIVP